MSDIVEVEEEEIDHDCTSNIVCPYCGYEDEDSYEHYEEGETNLDCKDCGRNFNLSVGVSYYFSSNRISCEEENEEHEWTDHFFRKEEESKEKELIILLECRKCKHNEIEEVSKEEWLQRRSDFNEKV